MSRLRHRNKKADRKILLVFFTIGVIIGAMALIFYKFYIPKAPRLYKIEKRPIAYPKKELPPLPRVAIVLDDFGYNYKNVEAVFSLKRPITFSILPNHPYSKSISRRVHQKGYEVILHLPLESYEKEKHIRPEVNTISINMNGAEVKALLTKAIETVSYCKGVSNHQGSKATENTQLMETIFTELKKRNLFYLDSLVTNKSVCRQIAKRLGVKFGHRGIFLDNKEDFEYIKGQMQQLIKKAKRYGVAIGIGHDRTKTVLALSTLMPEAERQGIEFVFLSELVK